MIRAAPHRGRRTKFIQHGSQRLAVAASEDFEDAHLGSTTTSPSPWLERSTIWQRSLVRRGKRVGYLSPWIRETS